MTRTPMRALFLSLTSWDNVFKAKATLELAKQRIFVLVGLIGLAFFLLAARLTDVMLMQVGTKKMPKAHQMGFLSQRADVMDRNGNLLATNVVTASLYANPKILINKKEVIQKLKPLLQGIDKKNIETRIASNKSFVWLSRHVPPSIQRKINALGLPGIYLHKDQKRVYTQGALVSHVLGLCNVDGEGLSGIEKFYDTRVIQADEPLQLSLDLRIQHVLKEALVETVKKFSARGGNAIVMHIPTGEVYGMVSLPDFDPNKKVSSSNVLFNRNTSGAYEPGSTFKILNVAVALESGKARLDSVYDATDPVKIGTFTVSDFRGKKRPLTLKEAFIYSSNIASIKIAQSYGTNTQKAFFKHFGVFDRVSLELPELARPIIPKNWTDITTMTASYGYGVSVTPLQLVSVVASLINDGKRVSPTLMKGEGGNARNDRVVSSKTSKAIRDLMRLVITDGTGKTANVEGYDVIGKTGTAYQSDGKGYGGRKKSRTTTFIGAFPKDNPQFILLTMLDNPQGNKKTFGFATAGWNVTPMAGKIIGKIAPMLVSPRISSSNDKMNCLIPTKFKRTIQ